MAAANQLTPIDAERQAEPQTWSGHVLIPVVQNLLGGGAVGALGLIGFVATQSWRNADWYVSDAALWCVLAGGVVTCAVTIIRFFGDDLGVVAAAYRAGVESQQARIAALELELRASHDATHAAEADGNSDTALKKRQELLLRARKDCERILAVHFQGDSIKRAAMAERNMGQRDWERAMRLLRAAGVMNGDGVIIAKSPREALRAVDERLATDGQRGKTFTPAWR